MGPYLRVEEWAHSFPSFLIALSKRSPPVPVHRKAVGATQQGTHVTTIRGRELLNWRRGQSPAPQTLTFGAGRGAN